MVGTLAKSKPICTREGAYKWGSFLFDSFSDCVWFWDGKGKIVNNQEQKSENRTRS